MEPFVVSALKYRPQRFDDVVGQQSITQTLENAIAKDHLAQALLFCGPRGVGKTTCARILAKKINDSDESPSSDNDFAFNIFELDAASNNSVEDIRNLIDQVRIPPQVGKYKVYIIDEVHMLSQAAFNAFLKTLEEPPAHAIFILATTEKHKIIPTILSRCQIFDFKRIGVTDAKNYLQKIADNEGINAEEEALQLIAQKADGAMRDALSIFDRVVSFSNQNITAESVSINLSILDFDTYLGVTKQLIDGDIRAAILSFDQVLTKGFDGHQFIVGLASHFRDLWMCKNEQTLKLLEVGESTQKKYAVQAKEAAIPMLEKAIAITNQCDLQYKTAKNQRLHVELCLMQIASLDPEKKKDSPYIKPPESVAAPTTSSLKTTVQTHDSQTENPVAETTHVVKDRPQKDYKQPEIEAKSVVEEPSPTPKAEQPESLKVEEKKNAVDLNIKAEGVSGLSLSSISFQKKHKAKNSSDEPTTNRNSSVSQDELEKAWTIFVDKMEARGEYNLAALLKLDTPRLKSKTEIHLTFPNKTNKLELESSKTKVLTFLFDKLENDFLTVNINVDTEEEQKYVYTPKDKYEELVKANPLVDAMRKDFDLDL